MRRRTMTDDRRRTTDDGRRRRTDDTYDIYRYMYARTCPLNGEGKWASRRMSIVGFEANAAIRGQLDGDCGDIVGKHGGGRTE